MSRSIASLWILAVAVGCVRVESPSPLPTHAVFCVLSPGDSLLVATMSRVVPVGERYRLDSAVSIPNAVVTISGKFRTVRLAYNAAKRRYEAANDRFVLPRETYRLRVQLPNQLPLEASCRVPAECPEMKVQGEKNGEDFAFNVTWPDVPGEDNQYFLTASVEGNGFVQSPNGTIGIVNLLVSWGTGFGSRVVTTDKNQDGQRLFSPEGTVRKAFPSRDSLVLRVVLENANPDYFDYSQAVASQRTSDDGLIGRLKEPVLVPSNVENGLGIFGAYTRRTVRVRIN